MNRAFSAESCLIGFNPGALPQADDQDAPLTRNALTRPPIGTHNHQSEERQLSAILASRVLYSATNDLRNWSKVPAAISARARFINCK